MPDARRHIIRADCARPETIGYMQRNGYSRVTGVDNWPGSVEDGIAHVRQYEMIVLHPRCTHTAEEMRLDSYKIDRLTGRIKLEPDHKLNYTIDALRYALSPLIRSKDTGLLEFYRLEVEAMKANQTSAQANAT